MHRQLAEKQRGHSNNTKRNVDCAPVETSEGQVTKALPHQSIDLFSMKKIETSITPVYFWQLC
jgi:hypothetical protein